MYSNLHAMRGYVYLLLNKVNGKRYVGQTSKTVEERFQEHCGQSASGSSYKIHRALRKYGKDNFEVITLMYVDSDTREGLISKLNYCEKYFVKKFDSRKNGYNMTNGGDGTLGYEWNDNQRMLQSERCKRQWKTQKCVFKKGLKKAQKLAILVRNKKVVQFDLNGNFIQVFESVVLAKKSLNFKAPNIDSCCRHSPKHLTSGGFIWRYLDEFNGEVPSKIEVPKLFNWEELHKRIAKKVSKSVLVFKDGVFVKEFFSKRELYLRFGLTRMKLNRLFKKEIPYNGFTFKMK